MSITKLLNNRFLAVGALALVLAGLVLALSPQARAEVVFLTRQNRIMSVYPAYNAFSIGTSTVPGSGNATSTTGIGKLSITLNPDDAFLNSLEGYRKAFQIASTTTVGGTATTTKDLFSIRDTGCVNTVATSTATPIHLVLLAVATTSSNGFVTWAYGACQ